MYTLTQVPSRDRRFSRHPVLRHGPLDLRLAGSEDGAQKGQHGGVHLIAVRLLLEGEEHLWTFLRVQGIEPTNNAAERALLHAVLRRKSSGGTASEWGSRFVERVLSVAATCRQQGRNVLEYLTECFRAHLTGGRLPSLLASDPGID